MSVFQITLIESISLALALALEVPWGILADRIGYRRSMILCCGLYFVSKIVFWQADSFGGFLAERLMLSVVCAGLSGLDVSILYLSGPEEESHRVFGIYNNLGMAGLLAASAVYAVFVGENYRLAGLLTVFSYGAAAVLALFLREVRSSQPRPAGRQLAEFKVLLGQLVRNPRLLFLVLGAAFLNEAHQTITTFLNQVQYTRAGLSASVIAVIYVVMTLLGLCGGFSARLTGWLGEKCTGAVLLALAAVACLTLTLTCGPVLSVAAILLLRVCHSLFTPLQTTLQNRQVRTADRATALSLNALPWIWWRCSPIWCSAGRRISPCRWPWASASCCVPPGWCCIFTARGAASGQTDPYTQKGTDIPDEYPCLFFDLNQQPFSL